MRKIAHKILSKLTYNVIVKETPKQAYFCDLANFKNNLQIILQNNCKWLVLDFEQFYMSHSIIHFIKQNSKKGNYYFLNVLNRRFQHQRTIAKRNNKIRKCNFLLYFPQKSSTWNHSIEMKLINESNSLIFFEQDTI